LSQPNERLSATEARRLGRTKSQEQVRVERGFTEDERQAARAWFRGGRSERRVQDESEVVAALLDDVIRLTQNTLVHARTGAHLAELQEDDASGRTAALLRDEFSIILANAEGVIERATQLDALGRQADHDANSRQYQVAESP
jgi:hypothetical protein